MTTLLPWSLSHSSLGRRVGTAVLPAGAARRWGHPLDRLLRDAAIMVIVKIIISPAVVKAIVETTMGCLKGMAPGGVPGRLFRDRGCCCLVVPVAYI